MDEQCHERCPQMVLSWLKIHLNLVIISLKTTIKDSGERYLLEGGVQYPGKLHELHIDLPFLSKIMKTEKVEKLVANQKKKKNMSYK